MISFASRPMRYPTPADTAASTGEALAREKVTKISSNFLLPLSDQAHVLRNAENRRQRRRLSRGHRRGKLILWCNKIWEQSTCTFETSGKDRTWCNECLWVFILRHLNHSERASSKCGTAGSQSVDGLL